VGKALDGVDPRQCRAAVDLECALPFLCHGQHQLFPVRIGRELADLDGNRSDSPGVAFSADGDRPVRTRELSVDRLRRAAEDVRRAVDGEEAALFVRERDEDSLISRRMTLGRCDRVPLTRSRDR
jgi:hypothetical protein